VAALREVTDAMSESTAKNVLRILRDEARY
jgi:hypothetical protein